ncbi:MAG: DNA-3-methyladenine glycosylase 2 family protein [Alphaproteobacteria bacterium]|nr:DNA-3-methyladenine glycosylase 2 family protein [Alphaproteobacteria bacterium]
MTKTSLARGLDELAARDPDIARALTAAGRPALRRAEMGFPALLRTIVGQQVSTHAARAIWGRVEGGCQPMSAEKFARLRTTTLRKMGLSRQKIEYSRALARHVASGALDLDGLAQLEEEEAIDRLIEVKGIGRWSAEIYLLFALGRADVWPIDDLALAKAVIHMKGLKGTPKRAKLVAVAEPWRPWRGAAAHLMWHYYHHLNDREGGAI